MFEINRSVVVIKAKQPMADWLARLPDRSDFEKERPISVDDINHDSIVYLAPPYEDPMEMEWFLPVEQGFKFGSGPLAWIIHEGNLHIVAFLRWEHCSGCSRTF